jgi:undecaprenyl-diphosphatase
LVIDDPSAPPPLESPGVGFARATHWLWPMLALGVIGSIGLAGYLIEEVAEGESFSFDKALILALRRPDALDTPIGPAWLRQSAIDISALGGFTVLWLMGAAAIGLLLYVRRRTEAACLAASLIGAFLLNSALKVYFDRPRPNIVPHLADVTNASFPSGHAMISAAIYLTIGITLAESLKRRAARAYVMSLAVLLVLLIGASRVYLGVHWPSDVLAGWALGAAWAMVVFAAERLLRRALA